MIALYEEKPAAAVTLDRYEIRSFAFLDCCVLRVQLARDIVKNVEYNEHEPEQLLWWRR